MSIGGEIMEEMYEENILPPLKDRITYLEAKIVGFADSLKYWASAEGVEGEEASYIYEQYCRHFGITDERVA